MGRMSPLAHVLAILHAMLKDRRRLVLENTALRQQLVVLRRSVKRPRLASSRPTPTAVRDPIRDGTGCTIPP